MTTLPSKTITVWQKVDLEFQASEQIFWTSFPLQVEFRSGSDTLCVDGYWNGGQDWTVRFAPTGSISVCESL